jgi:hypothetical protein
MVGWSGSPNKNVVSGIAWDITRRGHKDNFSIYDFSFAIV